jgi:diguanylate cyclase (GGDEF)-like protein
MAEHIQTLPQSLQHNPAPTGQRRLGAMALSFAAAGAAAMLFYAGIGRPEIMVDVLITACVTTLVSAPLAYYFELRFERLRRINADLDRAANMDELTGLANRRSFFRDARTYLAPQRGGAALLFIDADQFKQINDRCGHAAGDQVLRKVAGVIRGAIGPDDLACRLGGEEFAILLATNDMQHARDVGELIRSRATMIARELGLDVPTTVSVGVAMRRAPDDQLEDLLVAADRSVYIAKSLGRNRVVSDDEQHVTPEPAPLRPGAHVRRYRGRVPQAVSRVG